MSNSNKARVVIIGGGFAGLKCARQLGSNSQVDVLLIDRRNHHLFQPLLYQVAMAGLSPAEIAAPIRSLLSRHQNIRVLQATAESVSLKDKSVRTELGEHPFDYLLLAAGAQHSYFGNNHWEPVAPGLKSLEQATEVRRRVLRAFERAESESDPVRCKAFLTFVVVGGGPTGVELAGALGEMSRYTLARDYRNIDPQRARVILIEAGPRILPSFEGKLSMHATRDLERLGVQVWTNSRVTHIDQEGVTLQDEKIAAHTTLWAAGVQASSLGQGLDADLDRQGRVTVQGDLSLSNTPCVFVAGDQAHSVPAGADHALPGVATVALQQGQFVADAILRRIEGKEPRVFHYWDKGQLATIGRSRAILQSGRVTMVGLPAWIAWLVVHIYYLSGFRNRLVVLFQWAWAHLSFSRGARLIVEKSWRSYE